jgi:two-component sensor histidine kinase
MASTVEGMTASMDSPPREGVPLSTELVLGVLAIVLASILVAGGVLFAAAEDTVRREIEHEAGIAALSVLEATVADPGGRVAERVARRLLERTPSITGIHVRIGHRDIFQEPPSAWTEASVISDRTVSVTIDDDGEAAVTVRMNMDAAAPTRQRWTVTLLLVIGGSLIVSAVLVALLVHFRVARPLEALRRQVDDPSNRARGLPGELQAMADRLAQQQGQRLDESHRLGRTEDELQRASALQRLMLREMDHRVRNNLAAISALIELERFASTDVHMFADRLGARLQSMQQVQTLLSGSSKSSTNLGLLLKVLVPEDMHGRVDVSGPLVELGGPQAIALGMVLHELLVNALRHGALSTSQGRVSVAWGQPVAGRDRAQLSIDWSESGGPPPPRPADPGSGTGIVIGLIESELHGRVDLRYPPTGAVHRLKIGLRSLEHSAAV